MNLSFCVRWPQPIASGANNGGHRKAETGKLVRRLPVSCRVANRQSANPMSRTNIIALLIFGAILGYFLSFGPETTQKLRATNKGLRDVEHEVNRLRHALNYRERSMFKLVAAEVIARDSSSWWRTLTINRGKRDAIETDMPVVTDVGLVGKTTTVSDTISVVLLISDENCRVAASVEGSREQGIVSGERVTGGLTPLLDLNFLSKQADLKPGQKVYTSGVGGVFPSGLLIGAVKIFRVRELDGQAQLTPAVELSHLEDVFVVTGRR
ncbi:MAG: rod shape-determining protein MreC [Verrucomicrobia bacterium]|nr:MAG: rod shape-determining protein MreC [Verrucomicrobiota bacterium]